jgi:hypothetical protein
VEVKQQAKKKLTGQRKFAGQRNTYNRYSQQDWNTKNKGNRQVGKRKKMIDAQRQMQNKIYTLESKAKYKAYKTISYKVGSNYSSVTEFMNLTLSNLPKFTPGTPEILYRSGKIGEFRYEIDSVMSKNPVKFTSFKEIDDIMFSTHDADIDPNIMNYIEEEQIQGTKIIASDMVLATLMNNSKSYYSWDIAVEKFGDIIILKKREEKVDKEEFVCVDLENVGENSIAPPPAEVESTKSRKLQIVQL